MAEDPRDAELVQRYNAGERLDDVAESLGMSRSTAYAHLRLHGIGRQDSAMRQLPHTTTQTDAIEDLRDEVQKITETLQRIQDDIKRLQGLIEALVLLMRRD